MCLNNMNVQALFNILIGFMNEVMKGVKRCYIREYLIKHHYVNVHNLCSYLNISLAYSIYFKGSRILERKHSIILIFRST